jgi:hypothetical protein
MKNIHILPTDQPSRLVKIKDTFFITSSVDIPGGTFYNIHITSDEEIKRNDYYIHNNRVRQSAGGEQEKGDYKNCKKIILTTDSTLIADGVQAIDDEFLEWFVKNSSCEFVEVNKKLVEFPLTFKMMYKIIIPQEEPKQETLEEQMYRASFANESPLWHDGFIAGGKYMTERMYIEEEVLSLILKFNDDKPGGFDASGWFEQFKKK